MLVHDKAHELARALADSKEYKEYKKAHEKIKQDPKALEMLEDFRKKQLEVQAAQLAGQPVEEKSKQLENLFQVINYNQLIREFLTAEARFLTLIADVQKIIGKAVEIDITPQSH
ncbi:MAG: hypothetical protein PWQ82_213 [Thermosediminibacterales bacterium]|nr:hypothetical protein [Thermosediminibacterales bacterium]MDK2835235.1 hypothetical protein [Thermosediminibacterales bacterium]